MEKARRPATNRGLEENTMAILDAYGSRDSSHQNDDRIAFLDAVRSASIVPEDGTPPTYKMFEAIFGIFRDTKSLELLMASFHLLTELDKRFPRVYMDQGETDSKQLIIIEEAWFPFTLATDSPSRGKKAAKGKSFGPFSSLDFHILLDEDLKQLADKNEIHSIDHFRNMLVFQYLVCVLDGDFWPRNSIFLDTSNWISLRESILNLLLGSRQINYKGLVKNCLFIISMPFPTHAREIRVDEAGSSANEALTFALPEIGRSTQQAANKLLVMLLELDSSRNNADMKGLMTRGDGVRTSTMEIILDQLTYEKDSIPSFLEAFAEPKLKLEIVLHFFRKYIAKPSVRTRRSTDSIDDATISGVLKGFANASISKNIIKKIGAEVIQLLLAHTLQACLALSNQELLEVFSNSTAESPSSPLKELSDDIVSAFKSVQSTDESIEIIPLGKEALFAAATILTAKS